MTSDQASGGLPEYHPLYAPLLKRRGRETGPEARYFVVPDKDVKAGYRPKTMAIPTAATEEEAAFYCRKWFGELKAWRQNKGRKAVKHDLAWLIGRYINDDFSSFRNLREKTRREYEKNCRIIEATRGSELIEMVEGKDVLTWHREWGLPVPVLCSDGVQVVDPWGNPVTEASVPQRQRHLIVMLRILATHAVLIRAPGHVYFRQLLSSIEFPVPRGRDVSISRDQVNAFVKKAVAMGYRSQAIATVAQFELIERRVHIIGYMESGQWRPGWVWQNIDHLGPEASWKIRYHQDKVGRVLREFDLKTTPELLALLQEIPEEHRVGAVIIAERKRKVMVRQPWNERHYAEVWREIARAAGIPDEIWSMDGRAGGATEADSTPGVSDRALQDAGGWNDPKTPQRYRRQKQRNAGEVVKLRQKNRTSGNVP